MHRFTLAPRAMALGMALVAGAALTPVARAQDTAPETYAPIAPYAVSDANAGARPRVDAALFKALHGEDGVRRIADRLVDRAAADPRISDIFKAHDLARVKRLLAEQVCYLAGGGCRYTGRDMKASHKDLGLQVSDFNALVEDLQWSMDQEGVGFRAQNKLLALLAPMERTVVTR